MWEIFYAPPCITFPHHCGFWVIVDGTVLELCRSLRQNVSALPLQKECKCKIGWKGQLVVFGRIIR